MLLKDIQFFSLTISSKIPFHCLGRRCWEFDNCLILSLVSTLFALNDWKKGGLWTDNNNCHYLFFWQAAGHPFLINSPQQLREVRFPKIVNQGHYHMFIRNFMVLLKVLFEELRLDQKCKKKLARTSIKNYKSTSEAVVSSIVDYTSTTYNLTAASLIKFNYFCVIFQLLHLQEFHPLPKLVLQYRHVCLTAFSLTFALNACHMQLSSIHLIKGSHVES